MVARTTSPYGPALRCENRTQTLEANPDASSGAAAYCVSFGGPAVTSENTRTSGPGVAMW